ncbi:MAG TPA: hypothetical protein VK390_13325 [Propionibacteriaceae bacterium]|nr:hypothetical protein [Propionibacteriaceae bacterium]
MITQVSKIIVPVQDQQGALASGELRRNYAQNFGHSEHLNGRSDPGSG